MASLMEEFFNSSSSEEEDEFDDDLEKAAILLIQDEEESNTNKRKGSQPGRVTMPRNRVAGHIQLWQDYFATPCVYSDALFRRRFRMSKRLFLRIVRAMEENHDYFKLKRNTAGQRGFSALQKVTASIRILAYGVPADYPDEYLRMGEDTTTKSVKKFCKTVIKVFGEEYLRAPNVEDTARLMAIVDSRGFPGMLGSIDCMHWEWKNCPTAWHGQFTGHCHEPTIILEAVASQDLWIWHSYFGMPGSHNDINVLQRSPLFARLAAGEAPPCNYTINGHDYHMGYYLADGIYPSWATFVKTISNPQGNKRKYFANAQKTLRKDVERAFGVLQSRWAIVRGPPRFWKQKDLWRIMTACVIMHNMIIEDERGQDVHYNYDYVGDRVVPHDQDHMERFLEVHRRIEDRGAHEQLRDDLVEHLWQLHGQ